jgi:hypothetical protein
MVFNATFNNISVISWPSVLFVKETEENHQPVASHWQTLSHNVVHLTMKELILITRANISIFRLCFFFFQNPLEFIMGDILEYFEAQSRNLDEMSTSLTSPLPSNFTSVIRFNGTPILPPVVCFITLYFY